MENSPKILVVDDDQAVLRLFAKILQNGGYSVLTAGSGKHALEILQTDTVNLVVLDISMPEPDGFEVLKAVRAAAPGLRILAVSGFMGGALLDAAKILGANATLQKSEAPKQLLDAVKGLLQW